MDIVPKSMNSSLICRFAHRFILGNDSLVALKALMCEALFGGSRKVFSFRTDEFSRIFNQFAECQGIGKIERKLF